MWSVLIVWTWLCSSSISSRFGIVETVAMMKKLV